MTLPLVAIRPEPGLSETVAAAQALGLEIVASALFDIGPREWDAPDPATIDALLIGSANAFRHGGPQLERFRDKPVYAVGEATAEAARAAGFTVAAAGSGGLQDVLDELDGQELALLRPSGAGHVLLEPPPGIKVVTRVVYAGAVLEMPDPLVAVLREGAVVLLHSGLAARHFGNECLRLGLDRGRIALATLAPRVAAKAGIKWREVRFAPEPTDAALLALAQDMCHGGGPPRQEEPS